MSTPRILIVGGGYVGLYTAHRLQKLARRGKVSITVIDPHARMTYQPFLPEAAAGSIEPRHVVVALHKVLHRCEILTGCVTHIDHASRQVTLRPTSGPARKVGYDVLVVAAGSIVRTLPVPGLADHAIGLKSLPEAIYLRDHVLSQLDVASTTEDEHVRRKALTFAFVGGGYAGVETIAELEDMARYALRYYPRLKPELMRWVLVEANDHILPEIGPEMGEYTRKQLERRGFDLRLGRRVVSIAKGLVQLDDGDAFEAGTIVWTAGVRPNPVVERSDLPLDERKRVMCDEMMRVKDLPGVWAAGDIANVPDLSTPGASCSPSAQHAVRQSARLAKNIAAVQRGKEPKAYKHSYAGSVASLGLHKGAAKVYGVKLKGMPAWLMHRLYHVSRMPTTARKLQVVIDWSVALLFRREVVSLGDMENPRKQFREAAREELPHPTIDVTEAPPTRKRAPAKKVTVGKKAPAKKVTARR
ncbi:MAG: hypothetical protein QOJ03_914 [Frankiaceae bacterium]|jgi:NADH dehydrogenase|nr:hypothetical protein [Frankiaceae bacterium]